MADHRIAAVADLLGISVSMLRTWTLELAVYLSEGAQWHLAAREHRSAPHYNDHDVVLLCRAQRLREQGLSFDQIRDQLDLHTVPPSGDPFAAAAQPEATHAYERALNALHDALRTQGSLIECLQQETLHLRASQEQLAQSHSDQRLHYLAIIRLLVARELNGAAPAGRGVRQPKTTK